jgi:hypothetical protein
MGQTLKVLNAVRFYEIGIPLTHLQSVLANAVFTIPTYMAIGTSMLPLHISSHA